MMRRLTLLITLVAVLTSCAPAAVESGKPGSGNADVLADGRLSRGDYQLDSGEYYEALTYAGQAGQFITISLHSDDFDPYLMVLDPNGAKVVEIDDSPGYGRDIVISMNLPMSGGYTIIVTSFEAGETGRFHLDVESGGDEGPMPIWQPGGGAA